MCFSVFDKKTIKSNLFANNLKEIDNIIESYIEIPAKRREISLDTDLSIKFDQELKTMVELKKEAKLEDEFFKRLFDVFRNDMTSASDYLIKLVLLRIDNETGRLNSKYLCIASIIGDQGLVFSNMVKSYAQLTWETVRNSAVALWLKSEYRLKDIIESVAKAEYKQAKMKSFLSGETVKSDAAEFSSLYYFLVNKFDVFLDLLDREEHNKKVKEVLERDYLDEKNRKKARENAMTLISKKRYLFGILFFLLGGDLEVIW